MSSKDGGPAFARPISENGYRAADEQDGMSLRDYLAAKAMVAWLPVDASHMRTVAWAAYQMADAMLAAREKRKDTTDPTPP